MDIILSIQQFEELREEWNVLADRLRTPLLRHEWFFSCAKTFHAEESLRICIIRNSGKLVAAAPLVAVRSQGCERWEVLGASQLYEPCGFLYDSFESLSALIRDLLTPGFPLMLQRFEADSPAVIGFKNVPINIGVSLTRTTSPTLSLGLPASWGDLLAARSANFRYDLKRKYSKAKAGGTFSAEFIDPEPAEIHKLMRTVLEVEGSGWKGDRGSSLRHNELLGSFFNEYSRLAANEGMLRIAILRIDGKVIAVQLGIEAYERLWVLKMGYDEAYSRISPGFLLTAEAVRDAINRKLTAYEFLGVAEPWEERWGAERRTHMLVLVYPSTARGVLAFLIDGTAVIQRRVLTHFKQLNAGRHQT